MQDRIDRLSALVASAEEARLAVDEVRETIVQVEPFMALFETMRELTQRPEVRGERWAPPWLGVLLADLRRVDVGQLEVRASSARAGMADLRRAEKEALEVYEARMRKAALAAERIAYTLTDWRVYATRQKS